MKRYKKIVGILFLLIYLITSSCLAYAEFREPFDSGRIELSAEEQAYVESKPEIRVSFIQGIAPLVYKDDDGKTAGILKELLDVVERKTGFRFEYEQAETVEECTASVTSGKVDITGAIPLQYISEELQDYPRSKPFLKSETVLMIHVGVDASTLWDDTYAAVRGSALPEGVNPDTAKYYDSREPAMNAVERGDADYCYANEFSIAYCTIKNGYQNVMSIPQGKEAREYLLVYSDKEPMLASIMNRALESISPQEMQYLILQGTSNISRNISLSMVMKRYGIQIACIAGVVVLALVVMLILVYRSGKKIKIENKRYQMLSELSDEYIYEYRGTNDTLTLSEKCSDILDMPTEIQQFSKSPYQYSQPVLKTLMDATQNGKEIPINCGERQKEFRVVNSALNMENGGRGYIIGKLIDISEEKERLQALLVKAQTDGLTELLNPNTTKEFIQKDCERGEETKTLFIIDVDNFKMVNDTFGHDVGDQTLKKIGAALQENFRDTDIVGRIGGDEFCVFLKGEIPYEIMAEKCNQLKNRVHSITFPNSSLNAAISIGVAVNVKNKVAYEKFYKEADQALYEAKKNGRDQYCIRVLDEEKTDTNKEN